MSVSIALVHHPVRDKTGLTVATSVTNLDVHDLARSARSYGVDHYFLVTPITAQRQIIDRILSHWDTGKGRARVPQRREALALIRPIARVEEAIERLGSPTVVATAADARGRDVVTYGDERARLAATDEPTLLLFGTGHGLTSNLLDSVDRLLEPIDAGAGYNHLSVRAAVAITLDRLLGPGV